MNFASRANIGRNPLRLSLVAFWILTVFVALFGGLVAAVLPWNYVTAILLLPVLLVLTVLFPEIGIVVLLMLVYGLIPAGAVPQISIGPGIVRSHELGILLLFALAVIKAVQSRPLGEELRLLRPVLLILALTLSGVLVGYLINGSPAKEILNDARVQICWLLVFLLIYLVPDRRRLDRLLWGLVFVGLLLSAAVVAQFLTGRAFIQDARVEDLMTLTTTYSDVTRSTAGGGIYMILFAILFVLARTLKGSLSIMIGLPILSILFAGVVVSFGRGIWIATPIICMILAFALRRLTGVAYMLIALTVGVALSLGGLAIFKPAVIGAAYERVLSTAQEGDKNSSLGWRIQEFNYATQSLVRSPVLGIGYGTPYKPLIRLSGGESDVALMRYSHNGYIGVWLKLGLAGFAAVLWFSWGTLRRGYVLFRNLPDEKLRAATAALLCAFSIPLITSVTQPEWLSHTGVTFFALVVGLLIVISRLHLPLAERQGASPERTPVWGGRSTFYGPKA